MTLIEQSKTIADPRGKRGQRYPLWLILFVSLQCTSVGGNSSQQNFACLVSVYGHPVGVIRLQLMDNVQVSEIEVARELVEAVTTAPALRPVLPSSFSLDALHAQVDTLSDLAVRLLSQP